MKTSHRLSAVLLATASLPVTFARGPPGGGWTGKPSPSGPVSTTSTLQVATETPSTAVEYSTPLVGGTSAESNPSVATSSAEGLTTAQGTGTAVSPGSATSAGTSAQSSQSSTPNSCGSDAQKISLQNNSGKILVIQAGAPWTVGNCGNIASGSTCTFCQTRGSTGGNLQVGYGVAQSLGSWIEGEWDTNTDPTIDISFIPGYSVPISCKSDITGDSKGWSTPLCSDSSCSNCNSGGGTWNGNSCENPAGANNPSSSSLTNGPCPAFFAPSQGGAYCYPNDNGVVGFGTPWSSVSCTAGPQYGGGSSKREESGSFFPRDVQDENLTLEARDADMARRHAGAAALGAHGGARAHARSLKYLVS